MRFWVNSEGSKHPRGLDNLYPGYRFYNYRTNFIEEWDEYRWINTIYLKNGDEIYNIGEGTMTVTPKKKSFNLWKFFSSKR